MKRSWLSLRVDRLDGEFLPPWWFMHGRRDWYAQRDYFYPVPVALAVRLYCRLRWLWDRLRSRPSFIDKIISAEVRKAYAAGKSEGAWLTARTITSPESYRPIPEPDKCGP